MAAIGLIQLQKLGKMLKRRQKNAEAIRSTINNLETIRTQEIPKGFTHGHYVCAPVLETTKYSTDGVINELRNRGIGSRRIYSLPCHKQPTYLEGIKHWRWNQFVPYPDYSKVSLPVTEKIAETHFEVPIHPGLTSDEVVNIQNALTDIFK